MHVCVGGGGVGGGWGGGVGGCYFPLPALLVWNPWYILGIAVIEKTELPLLASENVWKVREALPNFLFRKPIGYK